jgi:hypothetical protein
VNGVISIMDGRLSVMSMMMPHDERTAWIDDGDGSRPAAFARAAPMLRDGLSQWF